MPRKTQINSNSRKKNLTTFKEKHKHHFQIPKSPNGRGNRSTQLVVFIQLPEKQKINFPVLQCTLWLLTRSVIEANCGNIREFLLLICTSINSLMHCVNTRFYRVERRQEHLQAI